MQLRSDDGAVIELSVAGYQFPTVPGRRHQGDGARWDANWLVVRGSVRTATGQSWVFTKPCLTTWEAADLGSFLRQVAAGEASTGADGVAVQRTVEFTEPELAFEEVDIESDPRTIVVHLSHGSAPLGGPGRSGTVDRASVRIRMDSRSWRSAAQAWATELAGHPRR